MLIPDRWATTSASLGQRKSAHDFFTCNREATAECTQLRSKPGATDQRAKVLEALLGTVRARSQNRPASQVAGTDRPVGSFHSPQEPKGTRR